MRSIIVVAHNLRSTHNVGSLLRTAEGLGVESVYLTGYTPYPAQPDDKRMPHVSKKLDAQIRKTALGAEKLLDWRQCDNVRGVLDGLKRTGYTICVLEQSPTSIELPSYEPPNKIAMLVGREVEGVEQELLTAYPLHISIPMSGKKESFNVTQAAAMALFHLRFAK